jgi:hypothetical protein
MTIRTIWVTPEVERFLSVCASTPLAAELYRDMRLVSSGQKGSEGFIRLSVPPFLSFTIGSKAIYWHGPTDGAFYKTRILERSAPITWSLNVS